MTIKHISKLLLCDPVLLTYAGRPSNAVTSQCSNIWRLR
jgi:hypothetical protein